MKVYKKANVIARLLSFVLFHNDEVPQGGIWIRVSPKDKRGVYINRKDVSKKDRT